MKYSHLRRITFADIIISVILIGIALLCLIPILNTIAISLSNKTPADLGIVFLWPIQFTPIAYMEMIKDSQFFTSFGISVQRVLEGATLNVLITILMAYPLSKSKYVFKSRNKYMWFLLFTMLFNGGLVPTFLLITKLHMINTMWSLILPGAVPVFNVLVLMNFFRDIPSSLEEAAYMDGANPLYILWKIYVPLSLPAIAVITLFSAVGHWNSFFDGLIYINLTSKMPLQTYIQNLTVNVDWGQASNMSKEDLVRALTMSRTTFNAAKVIVSMLPLLVLYPFLQKYFVKGLTLGAVKE